MAGEAKRKAKRQAELIASEPRCIYCAARPTTIEHMPPVALFRDRARPKGMEFATCADCNEGTSAADVVASFFARIDSDASADDWTTTENLQRRRVMERRAPGVLSEIFDTGSRTFWGRTRGGVLRQMVSSKVDGPLTKAYLDVFSAKLAMALFREHTGVALPLHGRIETQWYANAGLHEQRAHAILSTMPMAETLKQGAFTVPEQFAYRYNTDGKEIIAALVGFHGNFHILVLASSNPIYEKLPDLGASKCRPGQLLAMMPGTPTVRAIGNSLPSA